MINMKWKCQESDDKILDIWFDNVTETAIVNLTMENKLDHSGITVTLNKSDVYEIIEFLKQIYLNMD